MHMSVIGVQNALLRFISDDYWRIIDLINVSFIGSMKKSVEFIILNCIFTADIILGHLPRLDLPNILDALNRTCLVLAIDSDSSNVYADLLLALTETAFRDDADAEFGITDISSLASNPYVQIKTTPALRNSSTGIVVLEKRVPDRSCLLTNGLNHKDLKGGLFVGRPDSNLVLSFINEYCATYKRSDGGINDRGQRRNWILGNLYSVDDGPKMKEIHDQCGDLEEFFYSGHCRNGMRLELPRCETVDAGKLTKNRFFDDYIAVSKPVIIKNSLRAVWPNSELWTNGYLRKKFGDRKVHIKLAPLGEFEGVEDVGLWRNCPNEYGNFCASPFAHIPAEVKRHLTFSNHLVMVRPADVDMKFSQFIDLIEHSDRTKKNATAYLEYTPVGENFAGFDHELPEMPFMRGLLKLDLLNMWLSDGNTLGKLHFDQYDNLLCQISGKKRVVLFSPRNNSRLYEGHIVESKLSFKNGRFERQEIMESTALTMSPVDIEKPNFQRFPEFADAIPMNCTIEPGDILFLPSFWWHEVQSYPDQSQHRNLAFNFWYDPFLWKEFPCHECQFDINKRYRYLL